MLVRREQLFLEELVLLVGALDGPQFVKSGTGLVVGASGATGFDMAVIISDGQYILSFDGWEETFTDDEFVRVLFKAALYGEARIRVDSLGGKPWRWTLERLRGAGEWLPESSIGRPNWRFWGRVDRAYLRNAFEVRH